MLLAVVVGEHGTVRASEEPPHDTLPVRPGVQERGSSPIDCGEVSHDHIPVLEDRRPRNRDTLLGFIVRFRTGRPTILGIETVFVRFADPIGRPFL